jgi:hypothetical protein
MSSEEENEFNIDEVVPTKDQLSVVGKNLSSIPASLGQKFGNVVKHVDFSHNKLAFILFYFFYIFYIDLLKICRYLHI